MTEGKRKKFVLEKIHSKMQEANMKTRNTQRSPVLLISL